MSIHNVEKLGNNGTEDISLVNPTLAADAKLSVIDNIEIEHVRDYKLTGKNNVVLKFLPLFKFVNTFKRGISKNNNEGLSSIS